MDVRPTGFENTIKVEFNPDDSEDIALACKMNFSSDGSVWVYVSEETAIAMCDRLNELFPTKPVEPIKSEQVPLKLPKEPEEAGFYITQQKRLLNKEYGGTWRSPGAGHFWKDGGKYTRDWGIVFATLGPEAFPLIPLNTNSEGME